MFCGVSQSTAQQIELLCGHFGSCSAACQQAHNMCCPSRFAERHRQLVNMLLRHNASLLQGSLAPLLRVPRLIDFDNKRTYFRARVRAVASEERHYGTLRICVRREHVFEDSFHQLRMRCGPS